MTTAVSSDPLVAEIDAILGSSDLINQIGALSHRSPDEIYYTLTMAGYHNFVSNLIRIDTDLNSLKIENPSFYAANAGIIQSLIDIFDRPALGQSTSLIDALDGGDLIDISTHLAYMDLGKLILHMNYFEALVPPTKK
jgi:hypothetical protein